MSTAKGYALFNLLQVVDPKPLTLVEATPRIREQLEREAEATAMQADAAAGRSRLAASLAAVGLELGRGPDRGAAHGVDEPAPRHLAGADLIGRQLLGGYPDVDTSPWALREWAVSHNVQPEPVLWEVED